MATGVPACCTTTVSHIFSENSCVTRKPGSERNQRSSIFSPTKQGRGQFISLGRKRIVVYGKMGPSDDNKEVRIIKGSKLRAQERTERKRKERYTYLVAAIMSSLGITSLVVVSVYYRFSCQFEGGQIPVSEMLGTFALSMGTAVGMEFWARWTHKELWHASLWHMHESHHRPGDGPFELNDVIPIINAIPAIALLSLGFLNKGFFPDLCFGAGLGITVFGIAYILVHDGLVHRRFPVGPIAHVPYLQKVAAAHLLHHSDRFNGVPFGLLLGPKELEEIGAGEKED
uniref:beta-carotene 3-hydroxylase n=1 Tax=Lonicera hybrid cultivar TaxID=2741700 RepID=A0A6M9Z7L5_9DIPS|nr:beta carotene hydroxylase rhodoxanthin synthase [Lonicera hybrid cultivar]